MTDKVCLYRRQDGKYRITFQISGKKMHFIFPAKYFRKKEITLKKGGWRLLDTCKITLSNPLNNDVKDIRNVRDLNYQKGIAEINGQEITPGNTVVFNWEDDKVEVNFI